MTILGRRHSVFGGGPIKAGMKTKIVASTSARPSSRSWPIPAVPGWLERARPPKDEPVASALNSTARAVAVEHERYDPWREAIPAADSRHRYRELRHSVTAEEPVLSQPEERQNLLLVVRRQVSAFGPPAAEQNRLGVKVGGRHPALTSDLDDPASYFNTQFAGRQTAAEAAIQTATTELSGLESNDANKARIAELKAEITRQSAIVANVQKYRSLAEAYNFNTDGTATAGTVQNATQKQNTNDLYTLSNPRVTSAAAQLNQEHFKSVVGSVTTANALIADERVVSYLKAAYGLDKRAARRNGQRTSEGALLSLGVLCGWPGALVAQQVFRHKTRKRTFRRAFWRTIVLNVILLATFLALATLRGWDLEPAWLTDLPGQWVQLLTQL